jgi:hypothetical protein
MGHHSSEEKDKDRERDKKAAISENPLKSSLEQNDLSYFAMIKPLLSPFGQKLVNFFVSLGEGDSAGVTPPIDLAGIMNRFGPKAGTGSINDLLPALMQAAGGTEQGKINPAMLTALMTMLNKKNED